MGNDFLKLHSGKEISLDSFKGNIEAEKIDNKALRDFLFKSVFKFDEDGNGVIDEKEAVKLFNMLSEYAKRNGGHSLFDNAELELFLNAGIVPAQNESQSSANTENQPQTQTTESQIKTQEEKTLLEKVKTEDFINFLITHFSNPTEDTKTQILSHEDTYIDSEGNLLEETTILDEDGKPKERVLKTIDGKIKAQSTYTYSENGNIHEEEIRFDEQGNKSFILLKNNGYLESRITYTYNKDGSIQESSSIPLEYGNDGKLISFEFSRKITKKDGIVKEISLRQTKDKDKDNKEITKNYVVEVYTTPTGEQIISQYESDDLNNYDKTGKKISVTTILNNSSHVQQNSSAEENKTMINASLEKDETTGEEYVIEYRYAPNGNLFITKYQSSDLDSYDEVSDENDKRGNRVAAAYKKGEQYYEVTYDEAGNTITHAANNDSLYKLMQKFDFKNTAQFFELNPQFNPKGLSPSKAAEEAKNRIKVTNPVTVPGFYEPNDPRIIRQGTVGEELYKWKVYDNRKKLENYRQEHFSNIDEEVFKALNGTKGFELSDENIGVYIALNQLSRNKQMRIAAKIQISVKSNVSPINIKKDILKTEGISLSNVRFTLNFTSAVDLRTTPMNVETFITKELGLDITTGEGKELYDRLKTIEDPNIALDISAMFSNIRMRSSSDYGVFVSDMQDEIKHTGKDSQHGRDTQEILRLNYKLSPEEAREMYKAVIRRFTNPPLKNQKYEGFINDHKNSYLRFFASEMISSIYTNDSAAFKAESNQRGAFNALTKWASLCQSVRSNSNALRMNQAVLLGNKAFAMREKSLGGNYNQAALKKCYETITQLDKLNYSDKKKQEIYQEALIEAFGHNIVDNFKESMRIYRAGDFVVDTLLMLTATELLGAAITTGSIAGLTKLDIAMVKAGKESTKAGKAVKATLNAFQGGKGQIFVQMGVGATNFTAYDVARYSIDYYTNDIDESQLGEDSYTFSQGLFRTAGHSILFGNFVGAWGGLVTNNLVKVLCKTPQSAKFSQKVLSEMNSKFRSSASFKSSDVLNTYRSLSAEITNTAGKELLSFGSEFVGFTVFEVAGELVTNSENKTFGEILQGQAENLLSFKVLGQILRMHKAGKGPKSGVYIGRKQELDIKPHGDGFMITYPDGKTTRFAKNMDEVFTLCNEHYQNVTIYNPLEEVLERENSFETADGMKITKKDGKYTIEIEINQNKEVVEASDLKTAMANAQSRYTIMQYENTLQSKGRVTLPNGMEITFDKESKEYRTKLENGTEVHAKSLEEIFQKSPTESLRAELETNGEAELEDGQKITFDKEKGEYKTVLKNGQEVVAKSLEQLIENVRTEIYLNELDAAIEKADNKELALNENVTLKKLENGEYEAEVVINGIKTKLKAESLKKALQITQFVQTLDTTGVKEGVNNGAKPETEVSLNSSPKENTSRQINEADFQKYLDKIEKAKNYREIRQIEDEIIELSGFDYKDKLLTECYRKRNSYVGKGGIKDAIISKKARRYVKTLQTESDTWAYINMAEKIACLLIENRLFDECKDSLTKLYETRDTKDDVDHFIMLEELYRYQQAYPDKGALLINTLAESKLNTYQINNLLSSNLGNRGIESIFFSSKNIDTLLEIIPELHTLDYKQIKYIRQIIDFANNNTLQEVKLATGVYKQCLSVLKSLPENVKTIMREKGINIEKLEDELSSKVKTTGFEVKTDSELQNKFFATVVGNNNAVAENTIKSAEFTNFLSDNSVTGIPLKYTRSQFVSDLNNLISKLPENERTKVLEHLNIKLTDNNMFGFVKLDKFKLSDYSAESAEVLSQIEKCVENFAKTNEVVADNPEIKATLDALIQGFPEFTSLIGQQNHMNTIDIHTLEVLQNAEQLPEYQDLSSTGKVILKFAILMHDMGKNSGALDVSAHQEDSAIFASNILKKFNLPDEINDRIINLVRYHHFTEEAPENFGKYFILQEDIQIAKILGKADTKAALGSEHTLPESAYQTRGNENHPYMVTKCSPKYENYTERERVINGVKHKYHAECLDDYADDDDVSRLGYPRGTRKKDVIVQIHSVSTVENARIVIENSLNPNDDMVLSNSVKPLTNPDNHWGPISIVTQSTRMNHGGGSFKSKDVDNREFIEQNASPDEIPRGKYPDEVIDYITTFKFTPDFLRDTKIGETTYSKEYLTEVWKYYRDYMVNGEGINERHERNVKPIAIVVHNCESADDIPAKWILLSEEYHIPLQYHRTPDSKKFSSEPAKPETTNEEFPVFSFDGNVSSTTKPTESATQTYDAKQVLEVFEPVEIPTAETDGILKKFGFSDKDIQDLRAKCNDSKALNLMINIINTSRRYKEFIPEDSEFSDMAALVTDNIPDSIKAITELYEGLKDEAEVLNIYTSFNPQRKLFVSSGEFFDNFKILVNVVNDYMKAHPEMKEHPEELIAQALDQMPQNIETKKIFESLGFDYDKYTKADKNSYVTVQLQLNAEEAKQASIHNLEVDLNDVLFQSLPKEVTEPIFKKLEEELGVTFVKSQKDNWVGDGFNAGSTEYYRLYKDGQPIEFEDMSKIVSLIKDEINNNDFWTKKNENSEIETARGTMYTHLIKMRTAEVDNAKSMKDDETVEIEIRKTDMYDIIKALGLGNDAQCCTALGRNFNEWTAPNYIMNKCIGAIELTDKGSFVGNTMIYLAKVDGKPALVLDNIELKTKYQNNNKIRDAFIDYAKKLCEEIGAPDLPIYAGSNRHKLNMDIYEKAEHTMEVIGNSGEQNVYLDFDASGHIIGQGESVNIAMYEIRGSKPSKPAFGVQAETHSDVPAGMNPQEDAAIKKATTTNPAQKVSQNVRDRW